MTYPKAVARRAQTPAYRAKEAIKVIAAKREEMTPLNAHERRLRGRLANGQTNGTKNHHLIAKALRFVKGGRATFLAHIERAMRNGDPEAREWWGIYSELMPAQQARVDIDDVCEASGITPDRLMAVAVSQAMRMGTDIADYAAAVMHPEIVNATIKSGMRTSGPYHVTAQKDRELLLEHAKFKPVRGVGTSVTVNANATAAAQAAAASQPSVPTFAESLNAPMEALGDVQRELSGQVTDAEVWADE